MTIDNTEALLPDTAKEWITAPPHETYEGLKRQFLSLKSMVNTMGQQISFYSKKSYETGEAHLKALQESLESERAMNAKLTEELSALQPAAVELSDIDVGELKKPVAHDQSPFTDGFNSGWNDCLDHLQSRGLIKGAANIGKGKCE